MNPVAPLFFSLLALAIPAVAQDRVVAPSPGSSVAFDLYDQPGAAQPARQIGVAEAGLPLTILARQAGYYQVQVGAKAYWLRGSKVRISRDTTANCGAVAMAAAELTAATPGAGKDGCK